MAIDTKASGENLEARRWRDAHEIQALREMVGAYRGGAAALATEITELRAETARLRGALRDRRLERGSTLIEVQLDLDDDAQDLVGAILAADLADLDPRELEDVLLVARELTAGSVRRCAAAEHARAMLRVEVSERSMRVEIQALAGDPEPPELSIVGRLSERWGTEHVTAGRTTLWAELAPV